MDIGVISVRYARALIKSALSMKLEDQVYQEMQTLYKSYIDVPELRFTIDNPMLSKDKKLALLTTALGNNPSELSKKFIALVLKEDRESTLQFMAASYITLWYRLHHAEQLDGQDRIPHHTRALAEYDECAGERVAEQGLGDWCGI